MDISNASHANDHEYRHAFQYELACYSMLARSGMKLHELMLLFNGQFCIPSCCPSSWTQCALRCSGELQQQSAVTRSYTEPTTQHQQ
jgi:hypothetical protein